MHTAMIEHVTYRYAVKIKRYNEEGFATLSPYNYAAFPFEDARLYHKRGDAEARARRISNRIKMSAPPTECTVVAVEIRHREIV